MPDLAEGSLLVRCLPQFLTVQAGVVPGMELVQVHMVRAQGPQRALKLDDHLSRRPLIAPTPFAEVPVAELGGQHPAVAMGRDRLTDQFLRQVVAVALGRVHQIHA